MGYCHLSKAAWRKSSAKSREAPVALALAGAVPC
jgi:hypothetical protein